MMVDVVCMAFVLSGSTIPKTTIAWVEGLIGLISIAMVVIGFLVAVRQIKATSEKAFQDRLMKERQNMEKDLEIDFSLKDLRTSMSSINQSFVDMRTDICRRVEKVEEAIGQQGITITEIQKSVSSAHKRMNDHRMFDHGVKEENATVTKGAS